MQPSLRSARLFRPSVVMALAAMAFVPLLSVSQAQATTVPVGQNAASDRPSGTTGGHSFGLKPASGPRIAAGHRVSTLGIAAADVLPTSVDLTAKTISPGNQGQVGSCVAWSVGYTLAGYYANAQGHAGAPYAPMYLYSQIHLSSSADGGGAYISSAWDVITKQGIAEKAVYGPGDFDFRTMPTVAHTANASAHRMSPSNYLFRGPNQGVAGITALEASLASGNPVEIAIPVYRDFVSLNPSKSVMTQAMATGSTLGGHALVAVGYNPTGLVVENSWGTGWGKGGYATLGWDFVGKNVVEASVTTGFSSVPVLPVVTGLSVTSASANGGGTMTVTGNALAAVDASSISAVTLVNTANPTVSVNAPVVSRTASTLTVTIPSAPKLNSVTATGAYRVVVTSPVGASLDNGAKDDFTYVPPTEFRISGPTTISAKVGGPVTLTGTGFGAGPAAAAALKLTATVANKPVPVTWVNERTLTVVVPAGIPGQSIPIVLNRSGLPSAVDSTLRYAATISGLTLSTDSGGFRYATLVGRGFQGATGWTLTGPTGSATALPNLTGTVAAGVLVTSDVAAQIKLPTGPAGGIGNFQVSFTPSQTVYPGAGFLATPVAVVPYAAPTVSKVIGGPVSAKGGSVVSLVGTNLSGVDRSVAGAVRLVSAANPAVGVDVPVTARTATSLTLAVPAAPTTAGGVPVTGDYKLVVSTAQGTVTAPTTITYLTPFVISAPANVLLLSGVPVVTVTGSGFGATADAFRAQAVTATLAGRAASVTWLNDTTVRVTGPSGGRAGTIASLIISRGNLSSNALNLTYLTTAARP